MAQAIDLMRRCPDCGLPGHGIGDMYCPEPQDHDGGDDINDARPFEDIDFELEAT